MMTSEPEIPVDFKEPQEIFSNELILDLILFSLTRNSQLTARLVCKKWNDRILANFHKKFALRFWRWDEPAVVRKRLRDVDPRLLSSLKFVGYENPFRMSRVFRGVAESWIVGRLRSLRLVQLDKKAMDCLIRIGNKGQLRNLQELEVGIEYFLDNDDKTSKTFLRSNALPKLRYLKLSPVVAYRSDDKGLTRFLFEAAGYLATFQSFVISAPNLNAIVTNIPLNLSGLKDLKYLCLSFSLYKYKLTTVEGNLMIKSAGNSLSALKLQLEAHFFPQWSPGLPSLTNLTCLDVSCSNNSLTRLDWTCLPNLKVLKLCVPSNHWDTFLPVPNHLKEMSLKILSEDYKKKKLGETIVAVLNSRIPCLVLKVYMCYGLNIFELAFFFGAEVEESKARILEFHHEIFSDDPVYGAIEKFRGTIHYAKLKRNWDVVRFKNWEKEDEPTWTELTFPDLDVLA